MRVKHVTMLTNALAPDKLGGLERYVRELAASLVKSGVRVTVVTKQVEPHLPLMETGEDGVEILRHPVPRKSNPAFALAYPYRVAAGVRAALAGNTEGVLHAHFAVPALWPAFRGSNYAYTFHGPLYREILEERHGSYLLPHVVQSSAVKALKTAEAHVLKKAGAVVALSEFSRTELDLLDPAVAERAQIIPGGVNTEWFSPHSEEPVIPGLLLTTRRLTPRTGVFELIQAMEIIVRRVPGARLVVAGDGGSRELVEAEIERLRLGGHVQLLGRLGDGELRRWYQRAALSIVPSQSRECFGLSTAESLATGTPTVVTPVGANIEVAGPVDPSLVAAGTSPEAIAECVIDLLTTPGLLNRVSHRCRTRVTPAYSWPTVTDRHLELYERLAATT
jgi:glycosyltransferase involved in cell wall biosynthesis